VDYSTDSKVLQLFAEKPYLTVHMNAKERNEYLNFKKGKDYTNSYPKKPVIPVVPVMTNPVNFFPPYMQYNPMNMYPQQKPVYPPTTFFKPPTKQ
jgi:hypothetical protein